MPYVHETKEVPPPTHYDSFLLFHQTNPDIYDMIVAFAREAKQAGAKTYGIGMIWEVLRWHYRITLRRDDFKLNNNHRSHYARLVEEREPDLKGFFEMRQLRSK